MLKYESLTEEQKQAHREANYRWRKKNRKTFDKQKRQNYAKGSPFNGPSPRRPWSEEDEAIVIARATCDREIAKSIHRSVVAIQGRRAHLKKMFPEKFKEELLC